jgi:cysteine synthase
MIRLHRLDFAGIGVAMAAAAKGYKCVIVMPQLPPMYERYIICRKFGAEVHLTAGAKGVPGMLVYLKDMLEKHPNMWCPSQFDNDDNPAAHMETTGPEIWNQCKGKVGLYYQTCSSMRSECSLKWTGCSLKSTECSLKWSECSLKPAVHFETTGPEIWM